MGDGQDDTTTSSGDEATTSPPSTVAAGGRARNTAVLVLIGVAAASVVFLAGAALVHRGMHDRGHAMHGRGEGHWMMRHGGPDEGRGMEGPMRAGGVMDAMTAVHGADGRLVRDALASLGVTGAELSAALLEQVDVLEQDGTLTADQATLLRAHIRLEHGAPSTAKPAS